MKIPPNAWKSMTLLQMLELRGRSDAICDCPADQELASSQSAIMNCGIEGVPIAAIAYCLKEGFQWRHWDAVIEFLFETATGYSVADLDEID